MRTKIKYSRKPNKIGGLGIWYWAWLVVFLFYQWLHHLAVGMGFN